MNTEREKKHIVDILFVLALFLVFTLSTLTLVLFGANIYQNTVNDMEDNYNARTVCSYILGKFRSNDSCGSINIGSIDGKPSLILNQEINDASYSTYIYEYDGYLRELFVSDNVTLGSDVLNAGNKLCPVEDFEVNDCGGELNPIKITVRLPDGDRNSIYLSSRAK